ncbi:bacterioferritin-associated ferredoxin [Carboxylicivirga sp. M1479]|uniref:(2Fe-2S)-binding protein n=1 Tax=Carboxylicivirga sp. M1479 TaxID=2594476 RepID=UPI00163D43E7|nr:(2Fe-2S)-binding protein [Carboxylicivirga sp. M1479]
MGKLICLCNGVKEDAIIKTILDSDIASLKHIQETTGAACNCGRCINAIESILERHTCSEEKAK